MTQTYHSQMKTNDPYFDWKKISEIQEMVSYRAEEFFDFLNLDYYNCGRYLAGPCPVHGGDNRTAFNFFTEGESNKCNWICYTHHCERPLKSGGFGNNLVGLIRGIKGLEYKPAVDFLCDYLKIDINNIKIDLEKESRYKTQKQNNILYKERIHKPGQITREMVRSKLIIPSHYYLSRGYSQEILDKYDVGLCTTFGKEMYGRVVVPVYDDDYRYVVGVTGRSIHEQHSCGLYHNIKEKCPIGKESEYSKWKNNTNFSKSNYLYNYWFAKDSISNDGYAILVEGPGDVWKLEELGIKNSLALFGTELTDEQMLILERSGAMTLIIMTDNDEAGRIASINIKNKCQKLFRMYFPNFIGKDAGELNKTNVTRDIEPIIKRIKND